MSVRKRELTPFGAYLIEMIDKAKILKCDFYDGVGMSRPYFYACLIDSAPPREVLDKMIVLLEDVLGPSETLRQNLYDLAAASRGEIPTDIYEAIVAMPECWGELRNILPTLQKSCK